LGGAARLLAELSLTDTDKALLDQDITATRFVDDFRIFLTKEDDPYDSLSFLAQQLSLNEGLALNAAKTKIQARATFLASLKSQTSDISDEAEGAALDALAADIYFDDEPDPEDIESLKAINLLQILQEEIEQENYDIGKVKVIFRALKVSLPIDAIDYITENFSELCVFAKEISLLMQALEKEYPKCFDDLTESIIEAILEPPASSVQIIRTWLLKLFVRGVVPISSTFVKRLEPLPTAMDRRQLHLIRNRCDQKSFFRMNKANLQQFARFEQHAFIMGSACLPHDEYEKWTSSLKPIFNRPTDSLFLKWATANKNDIVKKIGAIGAFHEEA
jgi:hypothetical protein